MIHPTDTLPTLLGCGINSRTWHRRGDGSRVLQLAADLWLVDNNGTITAEAPDVTARLDADEVRRAAGGVANLAAARLAEKRAKVTVPEEADEPWAVALAVALRGVA